MVPAAVIYQHRAMMTYLWIRIFGETQVNLGRKLKSHEESPHKVLLETIGGDMKKKMNLFRSILILVFLIRPN